MMYTVPSRIPDSLKQELPYFKESLMDIWDTIQPESKGAPKYINRLKSGDSDYYGLGEHRHLLLSQTLSALLLIVDNLFQGEHFEGYSHLYYPSFTWNNLEVAIHFDNFKEYESGEARANAIVNSLIVRFLLCFNRVKKADEAAQLKAKNEKRRSPGFRFVREFCGHLDGGYCIEARTSKAFDYASLLDPDYEFSILINHVIEVCEKEYGKIIDPEDESFRFADNLRKANFFYVLAVLVRDFWDESYAVDRYLSNVKRVNEKGRVNLTSADLFLDNLREVAFIIPPPFAPWSFLEAYPIAMQPSSRQKDKKEDQEKRSSQLANYLQLLFRNVDFFDQEINPDNRENKDEKQSEINEHQIKLDKLMSRELEVGKTVFSSMVKDWNVNNKVIIAFMKNMSSRELLNGLLRDEICYGSDVFKVILDTLNKEHRDTFLNGGEIQFGTYLVENDAIPLEVARQEFSRKIEIVANKLKTPEQLVAWVRETGCMGFAFYPQARSCSFFMVMNAFTKYFKVLDYFPDILKETCLDELLFAKLNNQPIDLIIESIPTLQELYPKKNIIIKVLHLVMSMPGKSAQDLESLLNYLHQQAKSTPGKLAALGALLKKSIYFTNPASLKPDYTKFIELVKLASKCMPAKEFATYVEELYVNVRVIFIYGTSFASIQSITFETLRADLFVLLITHVPPAEAAEKILKCTHFKDFDAAMLALAHVPSQGASVLEALFRANSGGDIVDKFEQWHLSVRQTGIYLNPLLRLVGNATPAQRAWFNKSENYLSRQQTSLTLARVMAVKQVQLSSLCSLKNQGNHQSLEISQDTEDTHSNSLGTIASIKDGTQKNHQRYGKLRKFGFPTRSRLVELLEQYPEDPNANISVGWTWKDYLLAFVIFLALVAMVVSLAGSVTAVLTVPFFIFTADTILPIIIGTGTLLASFFVYGIYYYFASRPSDFLLWNPPYPQQSSVVAPSSEYVHLLYDKEEKFCHVSEDGSEETAARNNTRILRPLLCFEEEGDEEEEKERPEEKERDISGFAEFPQVEHHYLGEGPKSSNLSILTY